MHKKKTYNIEKIISRAKGYCSIQDRCTWDVNKKLESWGVTQNKKNTILQILIDEKFIDEKRFAKSFSRGKFRINNWGKYKIAKKLKQKNICSDNINIGLKEINKQEYEQVIEKLFYYKKDLLTEKNPYIKTKKIGDFIIQKGFERNIVWDKINTLKDK